MYFNILKRDLKRKKTMNIILLLFTILAAMFVSSGLNNVLSVANGTGYFFEKAGLGDFLILTQNGDGGMREILDNSSDVKGYRHEEIYWISKSNIKINDKELVAKGSIELLQSVDCEGIKYFLSDNSVLTSVNRGEAYISAGLLKANNAKVGDPMKVKLGDVDVTFTIAGEIKDAFLGSEMMGNKRIIVNGEDYQLFATEENVGYEGAVFYVDIDNTKAAAALTNGIPNAIFAKDVMIVKLSYIMEMVVAMIVLVVSICLVVVSFVLLKFVITFSINEDFREIGVMKAIGISNFKIRSLYMVKYIAMAIVGSIIGLGISFPFGNMLMTSVSERMMLGNDSGVLINIFGAIFVAIIMAFFAYLCTGKIKKSTPVDAIRSGQTGARFKKKYSVRMKNNHMGSAFYMAVNDIVSAPKRFLTIIISFFLCSILVFGIVLAKDTIKSDRLINTFGKKSDVYITDIKFLSMELMVPGGEEMLLKEFDEIEEDLRKLGMPGKAHMEIWYGYSVEFKGYKDSVMFQQNKRTKASDYEYHKGSAPQNAGEIAITPTIAKQLDATIGDMVKVDFGNEVRECMIVGIFDSMNQLGTIIRLHEDATTSMEYASALMAVQIDFDDNPSEKVITERIERLKEYYGIDSIYDAKGYCEDCIGVADTMETVSKLLLLITCVVVLLVTVLMERTFISDETNQIALLKAIGFKNSVIIRWQIIRFMLVTIAAELLAIALTIPVTKLWCDPIWASMGARNVDYYFKPLSLLVIYPGIIMAINFVAVWVTALYTNKITSRDITNIE